MFSDHFEPNFLQTSLRCCEKKDNQELEKHPPSSKKKWISEIFDLKWQ